jgi:hypothetical protein
VASYFLFFNERIFSSSFFLSSKSFNLSNLDSRFFRRSSIGRATVHLLFYKPVARRIAARNLLPGEFAHLAQIQALHFSHQVQSL